MEPIRQGRLVARLAEGPDDVARALALRHEAFFRARGLVAGLGEDRDAFDDRCLHVLVESDGPRVSVIGLEGVIVVDANARGVTVPRSAVVSFAGILRSFVVKNGKLDERLIKTGRRFGERLEVTEGLAEGDALVMNANDRMTKGQKVEISGRR